MLDVRAVRRVFGLGRYKRLCASPLARHALRRSDSCFAFLPTYFWGEKVTAHHCSQSRFLVDCLSKIVSLGGYGQEDREFKMATTKPNRVCKIISFYFSTWAFVENPSLRIFDSSGGHSREHGNW